MNTLLAISKVTDARRDVILAGGLNHRLTWTPPPPPLPAPQLLNILFWNCTEQFGEWHIWSALYKSILVLEVSILMQILISSSFYIVFALPLSYFNVSLLIWTIFDKDRGGPNGKLGE